MLTLAQARKYVSKPESKVTDTYEKDGTTQDIINTMLYADKYEVQHRYMQQLAPLLRGGDDYETCDNVFQFARKNFKYIADPRGWEKVKSSRWVIWYGNTQGQDCKTYSIAIISILRELGIKCKYRFVSWDASMDVSHVYPIAILKDGGAFEFPVAVDAIPDSCGFNCEIRYAYKKDYDMSSLRISHIDGVNATNQGSSNDVPNAVPINFVALTDGEAALAIAKERLKLLVAVHPDAPAADAWRKGLIWIDNALFRGLHTDNVALPFGLFKSKEEQNIISFIKNAQRRFAPAQGNMIALMDRTSPIQGIRELGHLGDIKFEDCNNLCFIEQTSQGEDIYDQDCLSKCLERNELAKEVIKIGQQIPHHFMYEYMTDLQIPLIREDKKRKYYLQQGAVDDIAYFSKVSRSLVREYYKTEIMRKHAEQPNIGVAMTPEEAINYFIQYPEKTLWDLKNEGKIGDPFTLLVGIAILVFSSGTIAIGVIQALRDKEPTALDRFVNVMGIVWNPDKTAAMLSDPGDMKLTSDQPCGAGYTRGATGQCVPDTTQPTSSNASSWLLPVAAGGTILYGLSTMKKKKK